MKRRIQSDGYPPEYHKGIQDVRKWILRVVLPFSLASLVLDYGYFREWATPLVALAPAVTFISLLLLISAPFVWFDAHIISILPYFPKSSPGVSGNTFLSGKALARNCIPLDLLAIEQGVDPLSCFGFADDLHGGQVVWHDAGKGLATVSGILAALRKNPERLEESRAIIKDLVRLETCLQSACQLQAPFCLLLRQGNGASGQEMEVRAGYFTYGNGE